MLRSNFIRRVNKQGPVCPGLGNCWIWIGRLHNRGYGRVGDRLAHRVSYELFCGEIKDEECVLHKCDNPPCVNPAHLFLGTQQDNLKDMRDKGRQVRGEQQGSSILTEAQAVEIKRRYMRYCRRNGTGALAAEFGISPVQVWKIATGEQWRHLNEGYTGTKGDAETALA